MVTSTVATTTEAGRGRRGAEVIQSEREDVDGDRPRLLVGVREVLGVLPFGVRSVPHAAHRAERRIIVATRARGGRPRGREHDGSGPGVSTGGVAAAVARYADVFHAAVPHGHHVAGPLGAWLVLALAAPAARDGTRAELTDLLGMDPRAAHAAAAALLADPHPAVAAAAAVRSRPGIGTDAFDAWQAGLPSQVTRGPVPPREQIDTWVRRATLGLIDTFPVEVTPGTLLVLGSALAARVAWLEPFATALSTALGGPWAEQVSRALLARDGAGGVISCDGELFGVLAADSGDGLSVVSVIADATVPRRRVLAVAHRLGPGPLPDRIEPVALPRGTTAGFLTVAETADLTADVYGRTGPYRVTLPAWRARTRTDLLAADDFGFTTLTRALQGVLARPIGGATAVQAAVARYGKDGFDAAVLSGYAIVAKPPGPYVTADLRFDHPYAVVAFADEPVLDRLARPPATTPGRPRNHLARPPRLQRLDHRTHRRPLRPRYPLRQVPRGAP